MAIFVLTVVYIKQYTHGSEPVLGESQESPSISEEGAVRVERCGVKSPPWPWSREMFDAAKGHAPIASLLQHMEELFTFVPRNRRLV